MKTVRTSTGHTLTFKEDTGSQKTLAFPNLKLGLSSFPTGDVKFNSVEPYTKNRLSALPFADIIRDYKVISDGVVPENPLKFLYPDVPKDEAFGRLYNSQPSKGKI